MQLYLRLKKKIPMDKCRQSYVVGQCMKYNYMLFLSFNNEELNYTLSI